MRPTDDGSMGFGAADDTPLEARPVPRLAVVRPQDPQLGQRRMLELLADAAKGLTPEEQERRFNENLRAQPHRFMGLLKGVRIVDHDGNDLGETQQGDLYIDYDELVKKTMAPKE